MMRYDDILSRFGPLLALLMIILAVLIEAAYY